MRNEWLRRLFDRHVASRTPIVNRLRPRMELLEDRSVPTVFTVDIPGDGGVGAGLHGDLRYCVNLANAFVGNDTINVNLGGSATITLNPGLGTLNFTDTTGSTKLQGPGAALLTVSGGNAIEVFSVAPGANAWLDALTVANGSTTLNGGGIANSGTLTVSNSTIKDNVTTSLLGGFGAGAGIYSTGNLTVNNSKFTNNIAIRNGGGIDSSGSLNVSGSSFNDNQAVGIPFSSIGAGGGINHGLGSATVTTSTFANNFGQTGGGISSAGSLTLSDSSFTGNSAQAGGGIANFFATMNVTNVTLSGNTASVAGAGISNNGSTGNLTLTNATIFNNSVSPASLGGGGLVNFNNATATIFNATFSGNSGKNGGGIHVLNGTVSATNTIVAGNTATVAGPDIFGTAKANFSLIQNTGSWVVAGGSGNNITGQDPSLAALGGYGGTTLTMALLPGSVAIDAGTSTGAPAADQRGSGRVNAVDIGAFESQGFTLSIVSGNNQTAAPNTAFANPLVVLVTANNAAEPVAGGLVTFTAPVAGASATFGTNPATIQADSKASVIATANGTPGSYTVTASANGGNSVNFSLTNGAPPLLVSTGGPYTLNEGDTLHLSATVSDVDVGQTLTISWDVNGDNVADASTTTTANGDNQTVTADLTWAQLGALSPPINDGNSTSIYTVNVLVVDDMTAQDSDSTSLSVDNVAPTPTINTGPTSSNEGTLVTFTGSFTDPVGAVDNNFSYLWSYTSTNGQTGSLSGSTTYAGGVPNFGFTPVDNGTYTITLQVTDKDGDAGTSSDWILTVNNVPPQSLQILGPANVVRGYASSWTGSFTDPGVNDTHQVSWDFGDGNVIAFHPTTDAGAMNPSHTYTTIGTYTLKMTIKDNNGDSAFVTKSITVGIVGVVSDPLYGGNMVVVGGSTGNDSIYVNRLTVSGNGLQVYVNGQNYSLPTTSAYTRVLVHAQSGDDYVSVAANVTVPAWLFGEAGNDNLTGGGGADVIVGGDNNDQLSGGASDDILIGGNGADTISGGSGDDLLIAGYTSYDTTESALKGVRDEWTSGHPYSARVANLRSGGGSSGGYALKASGVGQTVFDDNAIDRLTGGAGTDWFFGYVGNQPGRAKDVIGDLTAPEQLDALS